jgi:hypothetical protein
MIGELLAGLTTLTAVSVLSLRLIPDRWDSINLRVGLAGLTVSAEDDADDAE